MFRHSGQEKKKPFLPAGFPQKTLSAARALADARPVLAVALRALPPSGGSNISNSKRHHPLFYLNKSQPPLLTSRRRGGELQSSHIPRIVQKTCGKDAQGSPASLPPKTPIRAGNVSLKPRSGRSGANQRRRRRDRPGFKCPAGAGWQCGTARSAPSAPLS